VGSTVNQTLKALSRSTNLQYFNTLDNFEVDEVAVEIASVVYNNKSLEVLDASNYGMKEEHITILIEALADTRHLTSINLNLNKVPYNASLLLASFFKTNNAIEYLDLSHCYLTVHEEEDGLLIVISALNGIDELKHY